MSIQAYAAADKGFYSDPILHALLNTYLCAEHNSEHTWTY